jgi:hypothetical protein
MVRVPALRVRLPKVELPVKVPVMVVLAPFSIVRLPGAVNVPPRLARSPVRNRSPDTAIEPVATVRSPTVREFVVVQSPPTLLTVSELIEEVPLPLPAMVRVVVAVRVNPPPLSILVLAFIVISPATYNPAPPVTVLELPRKKSPSGMVVEALASRIRF